MNILHTIVCDIAPDMLRSVPIPKSFRDIFRLSCNLLKYINHSVYLTKMNILHTIVCDIAPDMLRSVPIPKSFRDIFRLSCNLLKYINHVCSKGCASPHCFRLIQWSHRLCCIHYCNASSWKTEDPYQ
ncbi:uncharacterized protein DC041_0002879 [Schistosoma bovis]|uniref:Iron sulphur domain-containing protein n=1 Tax=Schistosoma bovis TaxID=6184 RepID=A0A430QEH6_SCHBO|nr:uncharacterized protein DC041_0002879 [Schistosoma bovis]